VLVGRLAEPTTNDELVSIDQGPQSILPFASLRSQSAQILPADLDQQ
jgi:hypothetical protein